MYIIAIKNPKIILKIIFKIIYNNNENYYKYYRNRFGFCFIINRHFIILLKFLFPFKINILDII